jgi:hypothetical protein
MLEKATETRIINPTVAKGCITEIPPKVIPTNKIKRPFTVPLIVPPMIYAIEISKLDKGA